MKNIKLVCIITLPVNGFLNFFRTYVFADWEFVKWLVVLMVVDTLLGFVKHWLAKDVSSKAYGMIGRKLLVYTSIMILAHVFSRFTIQDELVTTLNWFGTFCCTALMVREGLSIVENVEAILPGFFPKSIITRLRDFDSKTGDKREENK